MALADLIREAAERWALDAAEPSVLVDGESATVRLPRAGAVLHVSRSGLPDARAIALQTARATLGRAGLPVVELLSTPSGASWERVGDRVLEVERWVEHDGRMNTWSRLRDGAALLARVHDAWADLDLGRAGETCHWANWIDPDEVVAGAVRARARLTRWGLGDLATQLDRLAELTAARTELPTQVVHGDFWDDNVYVRGEQLVAVTDFDFLGRRPRIDDLALLLYFADEQPYFHGSGYRDAGTRRSELASLVHAYAGRLATELSEAELTALPYALARQPLWWYAGKLADHPDPDHAHREAIVTAPSVGRALEVLADADRWTEAFGSV